MPAICDEIVRRSEFLTPVWGTPSSDHGRNQAWFEFASQLGELIEHGLRRAARLQLGLRRRPRGPDGVAPDRTPAVCSCPTRSSPERLAVIRTYCAPPRLPARSRSTLVGHDPSTGGVDLGGSRGAAARRAPPPSTSRRPSFLGADRADARRDRGARARPRAPRRSSASTRSRSASSRRRPTTAPTSSSARTQPLGVHMNCGGGAGGFIATPRRRALRARVPDAAPQHLASTVAGRARLRHRPLRADVVRQPRGGQRLDGQLGLPLGRSPTPSTCRCWGPSGFAELGRADPRPQPLRRRGASAAIDGRARSASRTASSRSSSSTSTAPARPWPRSTRALRQRGIFGGKDLSRGLPRARAERALLRHRGAHAGRHRPAGRGASRRWSRDAPPLPRRRLGRAARDGDGRARSPRRRLRRGRAGRRERVGERRGTRARPRMRRTGAARRCRSCRSRRCCATTSTSRRRRSG